MKMTDEEATNEIVKQHIKGIREKIKQELILLDSLEASLGIKDETPLDIRIRKYLESRKKN